MNLLKNLFPFSYKPLVFVIVFVLFLMPLNGMTSSGVAKAGRGGRSALGGTFMGAALWAML